MQPTGIYSNFLASAQHRNDFISESETTMIQMTMTVTADREDLQHNVGSEPLLRSGIHHTCNP
jgi:hypothetical protein